MDWDIFKESQVNSIERRAEQFLKTGKPEGDFMYAHQRALDNDGYLKVAALIMTLAPRGDIRQALEEAFLTQNFVEEECERIESMRREAFFDNKRLGE